MSLINIIISLLERYQQAAHVQKFHKMICLEWNKKNEWCKMLQSTSRTMTLPRKLIDPKQIRTCINYLLVFIETRFSTFLATSILNIETTTNAERPSQTKIIKSCSSQKSKSRNEPMPATSKCSRRVSHPVIGVQLMTLFNRKKILKAFKTLAAWHYTID